MSNFTKVDGNLAQISVASAPNVWGFNSKGDIFRVFLALLLAVVLSAGAAHAAGKVKVRYKQFPNGNELLPTEGVEGKVTVTAPEILYGKNPPDTLITYEFMFWNVSGLDKTNKQIDFTPADGSDTSMTAWYLETGGCCGPPCIRCFVTTWAFSLNTDSVIPDTTPIMSVKPDGLWKSPSTSVLTNTTSRQVEITAANTIPPGGLPPLDAFQNWFVLPNKQEPTGMLPLPPVNAGGSEEAIAFYFQGGTCPGCPHIVNCDGITCVQK